MKKFFYSLIITLVVLFGSWFVYNKFLYHIPVEDIPDSYFTYTGDIYTGTREDNGFYRMIDYFNDPKNGKLVNLLDNTIERINLSTGNNRSNKKYFSSLYLTGDIQKGEVYIQLLDHIEKDINYVLYSGFNLYDTLYGSGGQLSGYDQLAENLEYINSLPWEYNSEDIENHDFDYYYVSSVFSPLLSIALVSCYLKDYDRCYNYRSQAYQLSRNMFYSKNPSIFSSIGLYKYGYALQLADVFIENNG